MKYPSKKKEIILARQGYKRIVGLDEAGRGALAGPIVAAAVVMDVSRKKLPVKDSKQLSVGQREKLYQLIIEEALGVGIGAVSADGIDSMGIGKANRLAMELAINDLDIKPEFLLIDYFNINAGIPFESFIKGDQKVYSISAASIIAKVTRDRILIKSCKKYPAFSFHQHKGYGTKKHFEEIRKFGASAFHRRSFKLPSG